MTEGGCSAWTEEVTWYVTCWHYKSLALRRSCAFGEIVKRCSINSTPRVGLYQGHVQGSQGEVTCKGHVERLYAGGTQVARDDLLLQVGGVITMQTFWVKCRCQLVVKLKANKYYQELLCFLSSYINLLNLLNLQGLRGRLQAPGRFQTSSSWSRSQTSDLWQYSYSFSYLVNRSLVRFVATWPLSDELLALLRSDRARISRSSSVARSVNGSWLSIYSAFGCSIVLGLSFGLSLDYSRSICVNRSWLLASQTVSGPRQNLLLSNKLRTCIWSSTRIMLDHLATTRSSTLGKLLAL